MNFFNILSKKKVIKEEAVTPKQYYTFEEIENIAYKGFKDKWGVIGLKDNPNLFPAMFEWVTISEYKQILKFKHFRTDKDNYAPYITYIGNKPDVFLHDGKTSSPIYIKTTFHGSASIKYPVEKCIVHILAPIYEYMYRSSQKQVEDFSDVLEINYSPEAISQYENQMEQQRLEAEALHEREKIEEIKEKLLRKKRKQELEKIALQELMDEGEIFPEANKRPPIPKEVVDAVWNRDGGRCVYCGSTENLHLDHIIPFSKGGDTSVENLQLLCQKCNLQKSNKIG
ncbi:HNH endonuclease signature motif containing protein [Phocaeicola sp. KGMB11183]|uniref:HNH endonuclease signature motif containing protein n=1 Tax=Phocaeicola acetigenes TaxID=3016083 RepID=A0ABT4PJ70_9BACT|nr:HNH endonuclease signature motif containing protein [Phocaeicola sp. KGMB11183]MCZ8373099.1 HNH endonuclease signature motif containing protein [Phocaeicola sp. KGMB11183]